MKATCKHCGKEFEKVNGTSSYCPGKSCYKEGKKLRQKQIDDLLKKFRKGVYKNFKIFSELLPEPGGTEILLEALLYKGFDEHAFYGSFTDKSKINWFSVGDYLFSIKLEDQKKYINIYKQ